MRAGWLAGFVLLSVPALAGHRSDRVIDPPEAVAMADNAKPKDGAEGRFAMQVAGTGRVGGTVFLNSVADYRAPDALSFRLSPNVVAELTRRYGEAPEAYLHGKHLVVDGTVRRELIVNEDKYFPRRVLSANRWQHTVRILFARQIVAVD